MVVISAGELQLAESPSISWFVSKLVFSSVLVEVTVFSRIRMTFAQVLETTDNVIDNSRRSYFITFCSCSYFLLKF